VPSLGIVRLRSFLCRVSPGRFSVRWSRSRSPARSRSRDSLPAGVSISACLPRDAVDVTDIQISRPGHPLHLLLGLLDSVTWPEVNRIPRFLMFAVTSTSIPVTCRAISTRTGRASPGPSPRSLLLLRFNVSRSSYSQEIPIECNLPSVSPARAPIWRATRSRATVSRG